MRMKESRANRNVDGGYKISKHSWTCHLVIPPPCFRDFSFIRFLAHARMHALAPVPINNASWASTGPRKNGGRESCEYLNSSGRLQTRRGTSINIQRKRKSSNDCQQRIFLHLRFSHAPRNSSWTSINLSLSYRLSNSWFGREKKRNAQLAYLLSGRKRDIGIDR